MNISDNIIRRVLRESINKVLNETVEYDDHWAISDALAECGWAYSNATDVHHRDTGRAGVRYVIEPYSNNPNGVKPCDVEKKKKKMTELLGADNVVFSEGRHRYSPEITNLAMVALEPEGLEEAIEIDPKNKGKFKTTKKRTGKSTEELTHSKNPLTKKRAIFAQNAKKWNHKKKD